MTSTFLDDDKHASTSASISAAPAAPPLLPPKSPIKASFSLRRIRPRPRSKSQSKASFSASLGTEPTVRAGSTKPEWAMESDDTLAELDSSFAVPSLPLKYASSLDLSRLINPYNSASQVHSQSTCELAAAGNSGSQSASRAFKQRREQDQQSGISSSARSTSLRELIMPNRLLKRSGKKVAAVERAPLLDPKQTIVSAVGLGSNWSREFEQNSVSAEYSNGDMNHTRHTVEDVVSIDVTWNCTSTVFVTLTLSLVMQESRPDDSQNTKRLLPSPLIKANEPTPIAFPAPGSKLNEAKSATKPTSNHALGPFLSPQDADRKAIRAAHRRSRSFSELITSSTTFGDDLATSGASPLKQQPWRSSETWLALHSERLSRKQMEEESRKALMPADMGSRNGGWRGGGTFFGADMNVPLPKTSRARTDNHSRARTIKVDTRANQAFNDSSYPVYTQGRAQETLLTPTSPCPIGNIWTGISSSDGMYQHKAQSAYNVRHHNHNKNRAGSSDDEHDHSPLTRWHTPVEPDITESEVSAEEGDQSDLLPPLLPRTVTRSSSFSSTSRNTTPIPWAQRSGAATPIHSSPRTPSRLATATTGQSRSRLDVSVTNTHSSPLSLRSSEDSAGGGTAKTWTREDPSPPRKNADTFGHAASSDGHSPSGRKLMQQDEKVNPSSAALNPKSRFYAYAGRPQRQPIRATEEDAQVQGQGQGQRQTQGYTLRRSTSPHKVREAKKLFEHEHNEHQRQRPIVHEMLGCRCLSLLALDKEEGRAISRDPPWSSSHRRRLGIRQKFV
ncbi:hypothetical protein I316_01374 [Kwoniella heveanensis BCC8398]|uniref:Uncharacterized protein n=1 Tax=Kwoniella heveanensis BCC8398 TaxID=1296120 RepID=A0A1B9H0G0_9TREE|nr:hypothetical protein I316_01374 [Kwoniella heveanensis BCC8398]